MFHNVLLRDEVKNKEAAGIKNKIKVKDTQFRDKLNKALGSKALNKLDIKKIDFNPTN